jgi:hypothetical protein
LRRDYPKRLLRRIGRPSAGMIVESTIFELTIFEQAILE